MTKIFKNKKRANERHCRIPSAWQCLRVFGGASLLLIACGNYYIVTQLKRDVSISHQHPGALFLADSGVYLTPAQRLQSELPKPKQPPPPKRPLMTFVNLTVISKEWHVKRFAPPLPVLEISSFQMNATIMFVVGGFFGSHNQVSRKIQFFNVTAQQWMPNRTIEMPPGTAETHQGLAFDATSSMLYIVSGQVGAGCLAATTKSIRIHLDTGKVDDLPPLPAARFSPGAGIVSDPNDPSIHHLHIFGGASEIRNRTATNHWRLIIQTNSNDGDIQTTRWEELEPVGDAGVHGSGVAHDGYIYYTAYCAFENGLYLGSSRTVDCHKDGNPNQLLRHTVDAGYFWRFPTAFAPDKGDGYWERLPDIPFPICHSTVLKFSDKIFFVAGGETSVERKKGVASPPFNGIQVFDLQSASWDLIAWKNQRNSLNNPAVWIDEKKGKIYGHRVNHALIVGDIVETPPNSNRKQWPEFKKHRQDFITRSRTKATNAFSKCIKGTTQSSIKMTTVFDDGYDGVRDTWNQLDSKVQFPDIVAFPEDHMEVSTLIHCAVKAGYHVCARNGKHSNDGTTCTHGLLIDLSNFRPLQVVDPENGVVRVGPGIQVNDIAVALDRFNLTLPMGKSLDLGILEMVLSGGQGPLTRHYGLASDFLESIQLVDHSGTIINATANNQYSDYLWMARGGVSDMLHFPGIITSLQFSGVPKLPSKTIWTKFRISFDATVDTATKVLFRWQDFINEKHNLISVDPILSRLAMEPRLLLIPVRASGNNDFHRVLSLECYFFGEDELHNEFTDRLLPQILEIMEGGTISEIQRLENLKFHRSLGGKSFKHVATNESEDLLARITTNWGKSYSAVAHGFVPQEAFYFLAQTIFEAQPLSPRLAELKHLSGAIRKVSKTASAFWHRDASWWALTHYAFNHDNEIPLVEDILAIGEARNDHFTESMGNGFAGKYAAYIDRSNSTGRDLELCYGENAQKIVNIKMKRDPHNVFRPYTPNTLKNAPFDPRPPQADHSQKQTKA